MEGTNSAGDYGFASSLNYQHRNIFRGSELFSATIRLGGLRAKCGAVEADDTLDMKLEAQKDWFLQNSGMSIAL